MKEYSSLDYRKTVKDIQAVADNNIARKENTSEIGWNTYDSHLISEFPGNMSFNDTFYPLCPQIYKNIKEYIETEFQDEEYVVLVEMGGPASNLVADFSEGFIDESIGYTLTDKVRSDKQKNEEASKGHTVMTGNGLASEFSTEIKKKLGGKKINIFFERLLGGHVGIEEDIKFFSITFNSWYRMLADKAVMFVESPIITDVENIALVEKTFDELDSVPGLEVKYGISKVGYGFTFWIRLQRDKNAPADLRPYLKN